MRILYVSQNYLPEMGAGPGRISEMARVWAAHGHQVEVLAPVPNHPTGIVPPEYRGKLLFRETEPSGVLVTRTWIYTAANKGKLRRALAFGSFAAAATLLGLTNTNLPDVIIGSSPQLLAAVAAGNIATIRRVPWVFEVRDLWPESVVAVGAMQESNPIVRALHWVSDAMYLHAKHIVVVTNRFKEILQDRGIPESKISLMPNGVDLTKFTPTTPNPDDRTLLGGSAKYIISYIGTHGMAHDLGRLLDVATHFRTRTDIAFAFVGEGAHRNQLESTAKERNLTNVRFLGMQPRETIAKLYAASDICVVPLKKDPLFETVLPSKIFEVMAMERPILLAVGGEARAVVESAQAGICVEPGNTEDWVRGINEMLTHDEQLVEMGKRGRQYVSRHFDRDQIARQYLTLLESLHS